MATLQLSSLLFVGCCHRTHGATSQAASVHPYSSIKGGSANSCLYGDVTVPAGVRAEQQTAEEGGGADA